jgi:hypothetical protein
MVGVRILYQNDTSWKLWLFISVFSLSLIRKKSTNGDRKVIKTTKATDNQWLLVGVAGLFASLMILNREEIKTKNDQLKAVFIGFQLLTNACI